MLYLFVPLSSRQHAPQSLQLSPEAAALGLQPVPVQGELGGAALLFFQTVRQARQLPLQLVPGLLQPGTALLGLLDALLLLGVNGKHTFTMFVLALAVGFADKTDESKDKQEYVEEATLPKGISPLDQTDRLSGQSKLCPC